jgi:hypothetical protein
MKLRSRRPGPFRSLPTFRTTPSLLASSRAWLGRATKNVSPVTVSAPTALARLHPHAPLSSLFFTMLAWTQVSLILLIIIGTVVVSEWVSAKMRHAII